jgi:hypothetical protein
MREIAADLGYFEPWSANLLCEIEQHRRMVFARSNPRYLGRCRVFAASGPPAIATPSTNRRVDAPAFPGG